MSTKITAESLSVVTHNNIPVITTELLAQLYDTESIRIQQNYLRNEDRFIAGKHFFKLQRTELKEFKNRLSFSESVKKHARSLILWTERGAARHAKMLETDQAWDVFEKLEDFYFNQKQQAQPQPKTTPNERTPLREAVNMLVGKKGIMYPEAYSLIHQRFNIQHIDELSQEQLPQAVEYVHRLALEGEYIEREIFPIPPVNVNPFTDEQLCTLVWLWRASTVMIQSIESVYPLLKTGEHQQAPRCLSIITEYPRTLREAQRILNHATTHIHYESARDNNWSRVLPHLRRNELPLG